MGQRSLCLWRPLICRLLAITRLWLPTLWFRTPILVGEVPSKVLLPDADGALAAFFEDQSGENRYCGAVLGPSAVFASVVNTKSNAGKLVEQWETVNDGLEPLRRYTSLMLAFDVCSARRRRLSSLFFFCPESFSSKFALG